MGVTLYWVHDTSPDQAKTRLLVERAVPLIDRLVGMSRFRVFKPVMREVLTLYRLCAEIAGVDRHPAGYFDCS